MLRHFCASQLYLNGMDLIAIQETLGHAWVATTMRYVHVHRSHIEEAWIAGQQRAAAAAGRADLNALEPAAGRGEPRHLEGLGAAAPARRARAGDLGGQDVAPVVGQPASLKLDDLDVICAALDCEIGELLIPEPDKVTRPAQLRARRGGCLGRAPGAGGPAPAGRPVPAAGLSGGGA